MTKKQAKARATLMRRVLAIHRPVERLARRVLYAEPKRGRGVAGMDADMARIYDLCQAVHGAIDRWWCA